MANYCANVVEFSGELSKLLRLRALFAQAEYGKAFRPEFLSADEESSYFFGASMEDNKLFYETRWVPNLQGVLALAQHFGLDYIHQYDDPPGLVYGEARYTNGVFEQIDLEGADMIGRDFDGWEAALQERKQKQAAIPPEFRTRSSISAEELEETFGPLLTGDLFMKLAEHKNFTAAKALCDSWDEATIWAMETYLDCEMELITPKSDRDEVVALLFLRDCLGKWQPAAARTPGLQR